MSSKAWTIHSEPKPLVTHQWCRINDYDVTFANGVRQDRTVHEDGGGAGVLAITDKDEIVLLDLPHFPVRTEHALVIPGGGLHTGKTPLETAQVELLEETGLVASEWRPIYPFHRFPTLSANIMHLFYATGVREATEEEKRGLRADSNEIINEVLFMPVEEALQLLGGRIMDAAPVIALQWLQIQRLKGEGFARAKS